MRLLILLMLAGCSVIYITPGGEQPVNVQTTEPINVFGSQTVTSADKASKESSDGDIHTEAAATSVPTLTLPIGTPQ